MKARNLAAAYTGDYDLIQVEFNPGGKRYSYLARKSLHLTRNDLVVTGDYTDPGVATVVGVQDATPEIVRPVDFKLELILGKIYRHDVENHEARMDTLLERMRDVKRAGRKLTDKVWRHVCQTTQN